MEHELTLCIVLESPPPGVDFGLQKGRGHDYETVQKQRSKNQDLQFEFTIRAIVDHKPGPPNFLGPFVQGPRGQRFIYIDIGTCAGQTDTVWARRLKIPLTGITDDMVVRLSEDQGFALETRVAGTGRDGGPNCATVKPFAGWQISRRH